MSKLHRKLLILVILFISFSAIEVFSSGQNGRSLPRLRNGSSELLQVTAGGHVLGFRKGEMFIASGDHAVKVAFVGSKSVSPEEEITLNDSMTNHPAARPLGKVTYRGLWDGVNLVYENHNSGVVKSTYTIAPSSVDTVESIRLRYNVPVKAAENGDLVLSLETGEMRESRPVAWQEIEGKKISVEVAYRLTGEGEVGFKAGSYDPRYSLVIDPVLRWNTFMGSGSEDAGYAIAVDTSGNVYVAGYSYATWGTPINAYAGSYDAFVAKLNSSGVRQWNTFMGSLTSDYGNAIAVDTSGNVYVTGRSDATWGTPINAYIGSTDAFVAKLNSSGVRQWNTFMGASMGDDGRGIALDTSGNVYVVGYSSATWGTPINPHAGGSEVYVAKLNSDGVRQWQTFMGSSSTDDGRAIAVDSSGNIYVAGFSYATWGTPVNPFAGGNDAFVAKLNSSGVRQWNTFMGSSSSDFGNGVAVSGSGNVYVAGYSSGTWGTPLNPYAGGTYDAFVAKLNSSGVRQWNTFMGSADSDSGAAVAMDTSGNVYVAGWSGATWGTPINPYVGTVDAFVTKLNSSGVRQWHTFMGSDNFDYGTGIAVDSSGNVCIAGRSTSTWGTPVNPFTGGEDAFVAKIFDGLLTKNDFNNDGQEDILWRFYGGGPWQGWNAVWFLSQGSGSSAAASGMKSQDFAPRELFLVMGPNEKYRSPLEADGLLSKSLEKIRKDALEAADILKNKGEWQLDAADLKEVRIVRNPGEMGMGVQGKMKTAGLAISGSAYLQTIADMNWDIAGTGDFNGDGKTDILWRYYGSGSNQGANAVWYMNGVNYIGADWLMTITDTHWRIDSTGDFNGDGKTDILWRYYGSGPDQGRNVIWYMDGANYIGAAMLITITDTNWRIEGTGDFNGDGKTDIIWRYYGGDSNLGMNAIWYMNGANYIGADWLDTVADANWRIKNR